MIATMTTVPVTGEQLAANLAANLVADNTRVAGRDGQPCAVCRCEIRVGERVADLTGSRGLVHVSRCSPMVSAAPAAGRRGSSRGSGAPATAPSPGRPGHAAGRPGR